MSQGVENRKCHRFKIPDGKARYERTGLLALSKGLSKACPVINVSKGGLRFLCEEKFHQGDKLLIQLLAPNEISLDLYTKVCWQRVQKGSTDSVVGVNFMPFGNKKRWNRIEALNVLRKLDKLYRKGEKDILCSGKIQDIDRKQTRKAVLIVDDDPNNLELLAVKLTQIGYRVMTAQSGKDAVELISQEKPGLVLLDIMMAEMDGIETLKRIKAFDPDIPVAMVTAVWDKNEAKKTFEMGAYEYVTKPIDMEYLKMTVLTKLLPDE